MSRTARLVAFVLRNAVQCRPDEVADWVRERLTDHSRVLPDALARAEDRAWHAVALALADDSTLERVKDFFRDRDLTGLRDQLRAFVAATPGGLDGAPPAVRQRAAVELARLRRHRRLVAPPDPAALGAGLRAHAPGVGLVDGAVAAVAAVADELAADAPNLAAVLRLVPPGGPPLLAAGFVYFFRREVEDNDRLSNGLAFDYLRALSGGVEQGFARLETQAGGLLTRFDELSYAVGEWAAAADGKLDDIRAKLDRLLGERPAADSLAVSVTNERELAQLRAWRDELRRLPADAADWARLGDALAAGRLLADAGEAQRAAGDAARVVADRTAEADAEYKAFRVAAAREDWPAALAALRRSAALDPARYEPFPFNRYEPVRVLGAGGAGVVVLCRERLEGGREVAVKAIHPPRPGWAAADFLAEARAAAGLDGPGVLKVFHWDFADPGGTRPYLVMEHFDGPSLAGLLRTRGRLPLADALVVAGRLAAALAAAHAAGVLHRDVKPGNVLLRPDGGGGWDVRLIDFGLAARPAGLAPGEGFAGTAAYASPEQRAGGAVGPWSDVYGFGKTVVEAILGTTEPLTEDWDAVDSARRAAVRAVIERCLARDPARRFRSFTEVAEALAGLSRPTAPPPPTAAPPTGPHGPTVTIPLADGVRLVLAWCPPGAFRMGSNHPAGNADERPVRRVAIDRGFYLGVTPVTQAQWQAVVGTAPSFFTAPDRPVEQVSWDDACGFCDRLARTAAAWGVPRLPTEAEWEYACRAGTATEFWFGDTAAAGVANVDGLGPGETTSAGAFPANPWGLFDTHGNVWEWCADSVGPGPAAARVVRGGSWANEPERARAAARRGVPAGERTRNVGFRVAIAPG